MVDDKLLDTIAGVLKKRNLSVATAESCTGGLIAHTLTNISGSSDYFDRGVVSYSNNAKRELLEVPQELLDKYGAVSKEVAQAMAEGIRCRSNAMIGLSVTGIAGPTGGTKEKPVGLVYIAVATKEKTEVKQCHFSGNRVENKESTCAAALELLLHVLGSHSL